MDETTITLIATQLSDMQARLAKLEAQEITPTSVTAVAKTVVRRDANGGIFVESVIATTLENGWVNYGSGYANSGYYKDSFGIVHLVGVIKSGTITNGTSLLTLPVGYRPAAIQEFGSVAANSPCLIDVNTSGQLVIYFVTANTSLLLSPISFRV